MENIAIQAISSAALVLVAVLQLRAERYRKKRTAEDAAERQRQEQRRKDDLETSMSRGKVMVTSGDLAYVTSIAVTGGHTNGNVEKAQAAYNAARADYDTMEAKMARKYLKEV